MRFALSCMALHSLVFMVALALPHVSWCAEDNGQNPFQIKQAYTRLKGDVYLLTAAFDLNLTDGPREALESGLPMYIVVRMEVFREKSWWLDERLATVVQRYRLKFHDLSRRFLVENLNTGVRSSFSDLDSALDQVGRLFEFPLLDSVLVSTGSRYLGYIQVSLDLSKLPLPLIPRAYLSANWHHTSEKYQWLLK